MYVIGQQQINYRLQETSLSAECYIDEDLNIILPPSGCNVEDLRRSLPSPNAEHRKEEEYEEVACDCANCQNQYPWLLSPNRMHEYNYEY